MLLSNQNLTFFSKEKINSKILNFLVKSQFVLNYDEEQFSNELNIPCEKYKRYLNGKLNIKIDDLEWILNKANVGLNSIMSDDIDYQSVSAQFNEDKSYIPKKYQFCAKSRKRTLNSIFMFIRETRGEYTLNTYLRDFQLRLEAFDDDSGSINHNFLCDFTDYLSKHGYSKSEIELMGRYSYKSNKNSVMSEMLSNIKSSRQLFEVLTQELYYLFDDNYNYKLIKLDDDFCEIEMIQNDEVADAFKTKTIGSELVNIYKKGTIETLPLYIGERKSRVKIVKDLFRGDSTTIFRVEFDNRVLQ